LDELSTLSDPPGLRGVKLVISDAHEGLKARRREGSEVHLATLPCALHPYRARMVLALINTVFAQDIQEAAVCAVRHGCRSA
jgi:hypothetical protein